MSTKAKFEERARSLDAALESSSSQGISSYDISGASGGP